MTWNTLTFAVWLLPMLIAGGVVWLDARDRHEQAARTLRWLVPAAALAAAAVGARVVFADMSAGMRATAVVHAVAAVVACRILAQRFQGMVSVTRLSRHRVRRSRHPDNGRVDKQDELLDAVAEALDGGHWTPRRVSRPLLILAYTDRAVESQAHPGTAAPGRTLHLVVHRRALGLPWLIDLVELPAPGARVRRGDLSIDDALQILSDPDQAWILSVR